MASTQPKPQPQVQSTVAGSRLQAASSTLQRVQLELSKAVLARQSLETQLNETMMVRKEFAHLKPHNEIFKLVGPALLKQDQAEARSNVDKRLAFIQSEIQRVEAQIKKANVEAEHARMEIIEIQTSASAQGPSPGTDVAQAQAQVAS